MLFFAAAHRNAMTKSRISPGSSCGSDQRLAKLLAAIGKDRSDGIERSVLIHDLEKIKSACSQLQEFRKLLLRFRANTAKRRALRRQLRPLRDEMRIAGWLRDNPEADKSSLLAAIQEGEYCLIYRDKAI